MIRKVKGGYVIAHCHGANKGRRISATQTPKSKKKVLSIHRAIMARRSR